MNEKTEEAIKINSETATVINKLQSTQRNTLSPIIDQEGERSSTRVGIIVIQGGAELHNVTEHLQCLKLRICS